MTTTDIIIVDDHSHYRKSLKIFIEKIKNCKVVAQAENGYEFLKIYPIIDADIIFMDINMPEMNGIQATKLALSKNRYAKIIGLTMFEEEKYFLEMMYAGAKGFIFKDSAEKEIKKAIEVVSSGKIYYPPDVARTMINSDIDL